MDEKRRLWRDGAFEMNMRKEVTSLMRRRYSALALAVAMAVSFSSVTDLFASPVDLITQPEKQPVGTSLEILDEIMGQAVVEDVLKSGGFRPSTEAIPNFGQTNYAYWIRLHLKNPSAEKVERMLEIDYSNIDEVDFYLFSGERQIRHEQSGMRLPFRSREFIHHNFVFPVTVPAGSEYTVLLRLKTSGGLNVPLYVWTRDGFVQAYAGIQHGLGIYYGVMLVMILYNLFLYVTVRDRSYLFYVLYIFGFLGIQLTLTGHGFQYLWPDLPFLQRNAYVMFTGICLSSLIVFARRFLNTERIVHRYVDRFLKAYGLAFLALIATVVILPPEITVKLALLLTGPAPVIVMAVAITAFVKGFRPARYFLLAFTVLIGSGVVVVFKFLNILPSSIFTDYGLYIGSAMEVILLSIALADRINVMKQEKEEAQTRAIEMQKVLTESYARFVPRDFLASLGKESILDVRLGDQIQKEMAVLFSDIRAFTTLSEQMTPEQNFNFINSYLGRMSPIIQRHQGYIDKFIGDAIMALFERSIIDAVRAGVEMQRYLEEYNEHRQKRGYLPVRIGVGIHAGTLMLGTIGAEERLEGTVISDTVNLAARVESLTKVYGVRIAVTEAAVVSINEQQIADLHYRFLDRVRVKGKTRAISVYEILNGDEPAVLEKKMQTRDAFIQAASAFHARRFDEAKGLFEQVAAEFPDDSVTQLYLKRLYPIVNLPAGDGSRAGLGVQD